MATAASTLVARTRRYVRDYPDNDALSLSLTSATTSLTVASSGIYAAGMIVEVEQENLYVASLASASVLLVRRGVRGSTAASHAASSAVLIKPAFFATEILDALNVAQFDAYPIFYKPVLDTSLSLVGTGVAYEFTVPNMAGTYNGATIPIQYVSRVDIQNTGDPAWRETRRWEILRGTTPKLKFHEPLLASASLRVHGYGPFPDLTAVTDAVDVLLPGRLERILHLGAASELLASGEAGRVRQDTGARDDRESAVRPGASINLSNSIYGRYRSKLLQQPMPALPPHVVSVF